MPGRFPSWWRWPPIGFIPSHLIPSLRRYSSLCLVFRVAHLHQQDKPADAAYSFKQMELYMENTQISDEAKPASDIANDQALPTGRPQPRVYYQHKTHGGLYEISAGSDGQVAIWPQGGGFQRDLSQAQFTEQYAVAPALVMRQGTVTAEFLAEDLVLPSYSDGTCWNGWGRPRFDKETALQLVALMPDLSYNESTGVITLQFVGEDPEDYRLHTISCEGMQIDVYEIGGGWTWDSVKFLEAGEEDPLGQKTNEKGFLLLSADFPDGASRETD